MRSESTLWLLTALLIAPPAYAGISLPILASDEMPEGDDEMPDGDDDMPEGSDEPPMPDGADEMPDGEPDEPPPQPSPTLVAVPPAPMCSQPPRAEGYIQAELERPRSVDLHGLATEVRLIEGSEGCIGQAEVSLRLAKGCSLTMSFEQVGERRLEIQSMRLNAQSCSELPGLRPGRYLLHSGDAAMRWRGTLEPSCAPDADLTIGGEVVVKSGRNELALRLDGLRVRGDFAVSTDRTLACASPRRSAPIRLSSDRPRRVPHTRVWPWVAAGVGTAALAGGLSWYVYDQMNQTGSLTLQIQ